MDEIKQWLQKPDFNTGLILYQKYGRLMPVYEMLKKMGNTFQGRAELKSRLTKIIETYEQSKVAVAQPAPLPPAPTNNPYRKKAFSVYSEMGAVHARLTQSQNIKYDGGRFYRLHDQFVALMVAADKFDAGEKPATIKATRKKVSSNISGANYKRLCLLRTKVCHAEKSQIPKYRETGNTKKLEKRLAELEQWKQEINQLENG